MKNDPDVFRRIQAVLAARLFGVLATQGTEYPYCSLIGYAECRNARTILFATRRDSRKYKNLKAVPRVSVLIASQANQAEDLSIAQAVTAFGTAHEIESPDGTAYVADYLKKHPHLAGFVAEPHCALIAITVARYMLVSKFQQVEEFAMA